MLEILQNNELKLLCADIRYFLITYITAVHGWMKRNQEFCKADMAQIVSPKVGLGNSIAQRFATG